MKSYIEKLRENKIMKIILRSIWNKLPVITQSNFRRYLMSTAYSKLDNENKMIYIHIPKVAGHGILKSLFDFDFILGHNKLKRYKEINSEKYGKYYKLSFVRNPWDRIVSAYHYLKKGGIIPIDHEFRDKYLSKYNTFEEFAMGLKNEKVKKKLLKWIHFTPQHEFLLDETGNIGVDFLGKFETIEDDFEIVKHKLNKPQAKLKKHNQSKHKPYWEYYNKETVEIIRDIYSKDIKLFNYKFPYEKLKKEN